MLNFLLVHATEVWVGGVVLAIVAGAAVDSIEIHRGSYKSDLAPSVGVAGVLGLIWPLILAIGILFLPAYGCHRLIGLFVHKPQPKPEGLSEAEQEVEDFLEGDGID